MVSVATPRPPGPDERVAARVLRSPVAWGVAVLAAAAGIAWYLLAKSDLAWFVGLLLVMPLALMLLCRSGVDDTRWGAGDGGAWGPP